MSNSNTGFSSIPVSSTGLLRKEFTTSQKRNISNDNFEIQDINVDDIIKQALKSYNDASFNHVDISGELMTNNVHVDNCLVFY